MRRWEWPYRYSYTFAGKLHQNLYSPFRPPSSFRVLELQPGHSSSPVRCNLLNAALDNAPNYEALSYCWGDPKDTRTVTCNGRKFPVTKNLHEALVRLRRRSGKRTLWVDALCINQRDYAERNQQLRLMGRIYRKADRVVAWVGGESDVAGIAKGVIERLRALEVRFGGVVILGPDAQHLGELGLPEELSPAWSALRYFFQRAWFQRVWVIQEAANATQLDVTCGQVHLPWDDLVCTARCVAESPMLSGSNTAQVCQHIGFIDECRRASQHGTGGQLSLFNLLYPSQRCGATDLRDKIFGLYLLVKIRLLYQRRTTRRHCAGEARAPPTRSLNLPSWVPDWHSHDKSTPLAPPSEPSAYCVNYEVSQDLTKLTLKGDIFDEIVSLSDIILPFGYTLDGSHINLLVQQWPNASVVLEPTRETIRVLDILPRRAALGDFDIASLPSASYTKGWLKSERNQLRRVFYGRRVYRSAGGRLGLASSHAIPGDKIVAFRGGSIPFVIRRNENAYSLIGECFLANPDGGSVV
ncbi:hypothetical protein PMIN03_010192 [Paraphaeosphaeria minitans]|uniref:Heterokaryon incompatibility domain-containing protein n=1 Tax=Paraphaeosphaeria minitans TaxID=565426 RepID=A0A9P6KRP6_9PLEO|nr:hypothetical protein PMIN01_06276 [Paraphaeosphaeria minitans]